MSHKYVVYDSLNKQVWYEGDPSTGKKHTSKEVYGKNYKRFKNNSQARAYAIKLGNQLKKPVYDSYHGEDLKTKIRTKIIKDPYQANQEQLKRMLKDLF